MVPSRMASSADWKLEQLSDKQINVKNYRTVGSERMLGKASAETSGKTGGQNLFPPTTIARYASAAKELSAASRRALDQEPYLSQVDCRSALLSGGHARRRWGFSVRNHAPAVCRTGTTKSHESQADSPEMKQLHLPFDSMQHCFLQFTT